jgi:MFS family permease
VTCPLRCADGIRSQTKPCKTNPDLNPDAPENVRAMDTRNRIGLYGSYFLGMAGIGFTLPYLPLYLGQRGLSDSAIGIISTLAALTSLAQFPVGLWSDRLGSRKPFLVVALAVVAVSSWLLRGAEGTIWVGLLVILFAENGIGRAVKRCLEPRRYPRP